MCLKLTHTLPLIGNWYHETLIESLQCTFNVQFCLLSEIFNDCRTVWFCPNLIVNTTSQPETFECDNSFAYFAGHKLI
jgi:hypothetical protein